MTKYASVLLAACCCVSVARSQTPQSPKHAFSLGLTAGIVAEGDIDRSPSLGLSGEYTAWKGSRIAVGAQAIAIRAVAGDCDAGCNARTRAYGATVRTVYAAWSRQRRAALAFDLGAGLFRGRYSRRIPFDRVEAQHTVPGLSAGLEFAPFYSTLRPTFSIRALLLPDREGARARFLNLGAGVAFP